MRRYSSPPAVFFALRRNEEALTWAVRNRLERQLVGGVQRRGGRDRHLEPVRQLGAELALQPRPARDDRRLVLRPRRLALNVAEAGGAGPDVALGLELEEGVGGVPHRRLHPGAVFEVVDVLHHLVAAVLLDHRVEHRHHVAGVLTLVDPQRDVLGLGLLAEGHQLVPGLRRLPAVVLEQLGVVPEPVDVQRVRDAVGLVLEGQRVEGALDQRVTDLRAGDVEGRRRQQRRDVEQLTLVDQGRGVEVLRTGVVEDVRRGPVDETRLQLWRDVLRAQVLDLGLGVTLVVHLLVVLRVFVAEATLEDHHVERRCRVDPERVLRVDLPTRLRGGLRRATATAGRAGTKQTRPSGGCRGGRGPPQEVATIKSCVCPAVGHRASWL